MNTVLFEQIKMALNAIRSQLLRAILTMLIIAIGILAMVSIFTAIDAMKQSINSNFTSMGANTFTIRDRNISIRIGRRRQHIRQFKAISFSEAMRFSEEFNFPSTVSISTMASFNATLKYESKKTNPNSQVIGGDENYLGPAGFELEEGRNFSRQDIQFGSHVVILGKDLVQKLFEGKENPIDKVVTIGSGKYKVIGVLKEKGSSMGFGGDKICILPLTNVRQYFSRPNMSFTISVLCSNAQMLDPAVGEAEGLLRKIRMVGLGEENNFEIVKSDSLAAIVIKFTEKIVWGTRGIILITLIGGAIGLMNIMLVSVTERTREIGIRKAIGANRKSVLRQFLIEAIIICQIGGLAGVFFGIIFGNLCALALEVPFIMPWDWTFAAIVICFIVGVSSGIYPAIKASRLDPIEALRFE